MTLRRTKKSAKKNPVCVIFWRDAVNTERKVLPKEKPPLQATTGFIIKATNEYINIATNVRFDSTTKKMWPIDGFVIPKKTVVKFKKIGFLNDA